MAARLNFLIVFGHGDGDPGGVGQGTNERDFNRKILYPYLKKRTDKSQHNFDYYDVSGNKDMFRDTANGFGMYSIKPKYYESVTEIHEDASVNISATGGHNIVSSSFKADKYDLSLAQTIKKIVGWWGSVANSQGISYRNNLLNLNVAAQRGINYRLMELGFITNKTDMDKIKGNLDAYARGIIEGITGEDLGVNTVVKPTVKPVVYQTKPGYYESLKDDTFYTDVNLTIPSAWKIKKGQKLFLEDIQKVGKYTRAKVRLNNDVRYCTLRDDYWKFIYETKAKKIK